MVEDDPYKKDTGLQPELLSESSLYSHCVEIIPVPVDLSVKVTVRGTDPEVGVASNAATPADGVGVGVGVTVDTGVFVNVGVAEGLIVGDVVMVVSIGVVDNIDDFCPMAYKL